MRSCRAISCIALGFVFLAAAAIWSRLGGRESGEVSLLPGESVVLSCGRMALRSFSIPRYPDGQPRQFVSEIELQCQDCMEEAEVSVNHPLRHCGIWVYQSDYDRVTESETTLMVVRDRTLPLAVTGALLMVLGALWLCFCVTFDHAAETIGGRAGMMAVTAVAVPILVVTRVLLRPDQVPALQSPLLAPHVGSYIASYIILLSAAFGIGRRFMSVGFLLMTLGLVLGGVWGQLCWMNYWQNDPKELASLATWLVYFAYFIFRESDSAERFLRRSGAVMILLTSTVVNFSSLFAGLHSYG